MPTEDFVAQAILQLTEQSGIEWCIDDRNGGYFAVVEDWTIRIKGDRSFVHLTYQKGPKLGDIAVGHNRFYRNNNPELKKILQHILVRVKEQIFKDGETVKIMEKQEEKIRNEFCASLMGWSKK